MSELRVRSHDVVIVGGGNAGVSLAAKLRRQGWADVALVDPRSEHVYRPLLSYVGGGQATLPEATRPQASVMPRGVRHIRQAAVAVDPRARTVRLSDGSLLRAAELVLCPGVEGDWDAVPGSYAAVTSEHGATNYLDDRAAHTWRLIEEFHGGRALFAIGEGPIPCAGVGLKPLFLAVDHWRRTGRREAVEVTLVVPWARLWPHERVRRELERAAADLGIEVLTGHVPRRFDTEQRTLLVDGPDGTARELGYDLLHYVPQHRAAEWLAPVAAPGRAGLVDIDPSTLAHRIHPGVWALGDAARIEASPSGGGLRKQVGVLAANLRAAREGRPLSHYDGYSVAPVTTSRHTLSVVEFDRADRLAPSTRLVDLVRPRTAWWLYDRYVQPQLYWHGILRGLVSR